MSDRKEYWCASCERKLFTIPGGVLPEQLASMVCGSCDGPVSAWQPEKDAQWYLKTVGHDAPELARMLASAVKDEQRWAARAKSLADASTSLLAELHDFRGRLNHENRDGEAVYRDFKGGAVKWAKKLHDVVVADSRELSAQTPGTGGMRADDFLSASGAPATGGMLRVPCKRDGCYAPRQSGDHCGSWCRELDRVGFVTKS